MQPSNRTCILLQASNPSCFIIRILLHDLRLYLLPRHGVLYRAWISWRVLGGVLVAVDFEEVVEDDEEHCCCAQEDGERVEGGVGDHYGLLRCSGRCQ